MGCVKLVIAADQALMKLLSTHDSLTTTAVAPCTSTRHVSLALLNTLVAVYRLALVTGSSSYSPAAPNPAPKKQQHTWKACLPFHTKRSRWLM
jgi:hypothetical protein